MSTGGAERALSNILAGGLSKEFQNEVISLKDMGTFGEKISNSGVKVSTLNISHSIPSLNSWRKLKGIVKRFEPDIIQGWMYHGNLAAYLAHAHIHKESTLFWNIRHSLSDIKKEKPLTRKIIKLNRLFSSNPQHVIFNSKVAQTQHLAFGLNKGNAITISNGFDIDHLKPSLTNGKRLKEQLGIPENYLCIGHVARNHPMKNHTGFVQSVCETLANHPNTAIIMCGKGIDSSNASLTEIIPSNLRENFYFLGERDDIREIMQALDLFCLTSLWGEAFPNVLGEAMACGVTCIATDVGDSHYILGETGYHVNAEDPQAFANKLEEALSNGIENLNTRGKNSRARIVELFSLDHITRKYISIYEAAIKPETSK